jgi:hypothetical protein
MRRERIWIMAAVAIALAVGVVTLAKDVNVMFVGEEGQVVDLADLRDGESRVFGEGERQMTATRDGDEVRITREARGEEGELSITCDIARDTCQVITSEDGEEVAIRIEKSRECEHGVDDCDLHDVGILALGKGGSSHNVFVKRICEGDDCDAENNIEILTDAHAGADGDLLWVGEDGGIGHRVVVRKVCAADECDEDDAVEIITTGVQDGHGLLMIGEGGDKVRLGCPEGDASIWVDSAEADETFLCPKHSVPMEKTIDAKQHRIVIERN